MYRLMKASPRKNIPARFTRPFLRHQWKEAMSSPNKKPPVILIIMASPATIPDGPQ
uniref:Uncharacterized protein n=1 Tax=Escherichia coli TaxID=562 RepID=A0A220SXT0_ECOLX|nr:hypothetical protein [Escherichia coli]